MAHVFQVGAGSGGMAALDSIARDERVRRVTLVEPDVFKPHNVVRHLFPLSAVGRLKAEVAVEWLRDRRPDLEVVTLVCDLLDSERQAEIEAAVAVCDLGVCAADNEPAKYHFNDLMLRHRKPWTLGEVLSGGIGGWVHWFAPGGACYGCVAGYLKREVAEEKPQPAPDYSAPGGPAPETTVPAGKASIAAISSLHAHVTLAMLADSGGGASGFTSLLLTLEKVPGVFDEAYRPIRLRIPRALDCLICGTASPTVSGDQLDVALQQALARLGDA